MEDDAPTVYERKEMGKCNFVEFTFPGYSSLGPGTYLKRLKYPPALNKLDI